MSGPRAIYLPIEVARCRPANPAACGVREKCAAYLADVPPGAPVKDWLNGASYNPMPGSLYCAGYRSAETARKPAEPRPAVKPWPGGES